MTHSGTLARLILLLIWAAPVAGADSLNFDFHAPASVTDPALPQAIRDLAGRLIPVYQTPNPAQYLANLSALQLAAGNFTAANESRENLRERRRSAERTRRVDAGLIYDLYAQAKSEEEEHREPFAQALVRAYLNMVSPLDDAEAYAVSRGFGRPPRAFSDALQTALDRQRNSDQIGEPDAMALIWAYVAYEVHRSVDPVAASLNVMEDRRRYATHSDVLVLRNKHAHITLQITRPKSATAPLPALLRVTADAAPPQAMECAAHGYACVTASIRNEGKNAVKIDPWRQTGDDARAVIAWIAKQPWSDGRVGMYGDGFGGFAAWAAAKHLPAALKAIATSAAQAPGIEFPITGGVFRNSAYPWALRMTRPNATDAGDRPDDARWQAMDDAWYRSGRRYRDLGLGLKPPVADPVFTRWLNHPSYDRYWQRMMPYGEDFARIDLPVLTICGYYSAGEPGALHFFVQHHRFNPRADHSLLLGPFENDEQPGTATDTTAGDVTFQWFDHVLKDKAAPALLKDVVNYQVLGTGEWRHAASIASMTGSTQRLYLTAGSRGADHRLSGTRGPAASYVEQKVSLADRSDAAWRPAPDFVSRNLPGHYSVSFAGEPMTRPTEISGLVTGQLDFRVNKMDMDITFSLYELLPGGDYVRLFAPSEEIRASYARDRVHRRLLKAGERQTLTLTSSRLVSAQLEAGSRLVLVLGIDKRADRELNYGTGNDVSEESIADGKIPLKVRWFGDSYVDVPVRER